MRNYGTLLKHWAGTPDAPAYNSFGNGSAMRVAACAYAFESRAAVLVSSSLLAREPENVIRQATYQGSAPQALVAFREGQDFEDVIRCAVSIGGDSDTIACMAGAMAGAHFGVPKAIAAEVRGPLDERLSGVLALFASPFMP